MTLAIQKNILQLVLPLNLPVVFRVISYLILLMALPTSAENFNVDGCFECGTENYTHGFEVNYVIDNNIANGYLYFGQESVDNVSHQFMYFKMAEAYVDTVYGAPADADDSGWKKGHSFKDIIESDKLGSKDGYLTFTINNVAEAKLSIDLLACVDECLTSGKGKNKNYIGGQDSFASDGWEGNGKQKGDGDIKNGEPSLFIVDVKTSMDHNVKLDGFNTTNSLTSANLIPGEEWLSYVGYEFEFISNIFGDLDTLTTASLTAMLDLGDSHASPSRVDAENPTIGQTMGSITAVPETSSMAIFALGLAGLLATRRKYVKD